MAPLPGFERVPGSAGRYRNLNTGETISRRQYENQRIRQTTGLTSLSEFNRLKKEPRFQHLGAAWAKSKGVSKRTAFRADSPFVKQYQKATRQKWSRKADRAYARLLVDIGFRDDSAWWNVGDTPKAGGVI